MKYQILKPGDVRQKGDEVRCLQPANETYSRKKQPQEDRYALWRPASLLGHPILASDLVHLELRRPV